MKFKSRKSLAIAAVAASLTFGAATPGLAAEPSYSDSQDWTLTQVTWAPLGPIYQYDSDLGFQVLSGVYVGEGFGGSGYELEQAIKNVRHGNEDSPENL